MPTLAVYEEEFCQRFGRKMTEDEFQDLCFDYGLELDEVTSKREQYLRERNCNMDVKKLKPEENQEYENLDPRVQWKVDIPQNRYDLLCIEGLVS